ncbi:unnamed protein product [Echinostoma caproni]|uniref:Uncharacterized protein n=1 Tax=Echinostoma caproni TaxID=27848 RepID=A0A183AKG7_9TREM|nr:unnamed protein product [Echinostoma caproni]
MDACVNMFDHLLEKSVNCPWSTKPAVDSDVSFSSSYFDEETAALREGIPNQPDDEQTSESSTDLATYCTPMSVDNLDEQETDAVLGPAPSTDPMTDQCVEPLSVEPVNVDVPAGSSENVATAATCGSLEPPEKRRSARVRPDVDLTDGLNRYRSRRTYSFTGESRSTVKSPGRVPTVKEVKSKPLNRFRCAEQLRGLLPTVVRDLAKILNEEAIGSGDKSSQPPSASNSSHSKSEPLEETHDRYSYLWSPEAVAEFLRMLNPTKPNAVTFGIAVLLQVSQLHGDKWPSKLCELYVSLFERLRCSFPRWFLTPSEYRETSETVSAETGDPSEGDLLPIHVLGLRAPPNLPVLTRFHLIYVELRLEQLECILSPNSIPVPLDHQPRDPRNQPTERLLSEATVMILMDVLSLHDPGTAGFPNAHAHYLWVNYLLASIKQDYTEMEGYLTVACTNCGGNHVDLGATPDGTFEFIRATDRAFKIKLFSYLMEATPLSRFDYRVPVGGIFFGLHHLVNSHPWLHEAELQYGTCGHVRDADLLSLLECSLEHLIEQATFVTSTTETHAKLITAPEESAPSQPVDKLSSSIQPRLGYRASVVLLESALWLTTNQTEIDQWAESSRGQRNQSNTVDVQLKSLANSAFNLLAKFWDLLANEYSAYSAIPSPTPTTTTPKAMQTQKDQLVLINKSPIRFCILPEEIDGEVETLSTDEPPCVECLPSVGEACLAVCACLEWIAVRVEATAPESAEIAELLAPRFITVIFEHLTCIEQSIPVSALPDALRAYYETSQGWLDQLPDNLLLALYTGRSAAPPSLAWLHWCHELLSSRQSPKNDTGTYCRQRKDLLALLRQLVWRTACVLTSVTSLVREKAALIVLNQSVSTESTHSDNSLASSSTAGSPSTPVRPFGSEEEFVQLPPCTGDDDTVACVEDLIRSSFQPWPADCVSLNHILAQAILCLVPCSLFRQLDASAVRSGGSHRWNLHTSVTNILSNRPDAPGSENEGGPPSAGALYSEEYGPADSDDSVCITPLWIQQVNKLLTDRHWCSHTAPACFAHSVWWSSQVNSIPKEVQLLDWNCMQTVFEFCYPTRIPEYDSIKTLSISNELLSLLQAAVELIPPAEDARMLSAAQVEQMMQSKAKTAAELPEEPLGLRLAIKYYLEDLRACPRRSSTWAALGLIYYSDLEQIINLASTRSFPDVHLNICRKWRSSMLQLARHCYEQVMAMQGASAISKASSSAAVDTHDDTGVSQSVDPSIHPEEGAKQAKDEEWLCRYMLAKCSEKEAHLVVQDCDNVVGIAPYLLSILDQYHQALQALDAAGAKYPKKVIVYHKLPFRAVEAIEVYYRIHALTLKTLLSYGLPDPDTLKPYSDQIPLVDLREFLITIQSSEFVASCGKPRQFLQVTGSNPALVEALIKKRLSKPGFVAICMTMSISAFMLDRPYSIKDKKNRQ